MPRWNEWFSPRRSGNGGGCVEAELTADAVHIRNSKNRQAGTVTFTHGEWRAFIDSVKECDDYDIPG